MPGTLSCPHALPHADTPQVRVSRLRSRYVRQGQLTLTGVQVKGGEHKHLSDPSSSRTIGLEQRASRSGGRMGLPGPVINFRMHDVRRGGVEGGRDDFEDMITDLVGVTHEGVRSVQANPGDWGIDAYVGELDGTIVAWQAKYFIDGVGESQKAEIRDSFASIMKNSVEQGFTVEQWVLCIPVQMDGPTQKWWTTWSRKKQRETTVAVEVWPEERLRRLLQSPEAATVCHHYYSTTDPGRTPRKPLSVQRLDDAGLYDDALFVLQLQEAGYSEIAHQKEQFFNAELMVRDINDKGVLEEIDALQEADALVGGVWEERYAAACVRSQDERLPELLADVMDGVRAACGTLPNVLPARPIHVQGLMHRVVDFGRAGWVRGWRSVASHFDTTIVNQPVLPAPPDAVQRESDLAEQSLLSVEATP